LRGGLEHLKIETSSSSRENEGGGGGGRESIDASSRGDCVTSWKPRLQYPSCVSPYPRFQYERLKAKAERSTRLTYTGLRGGLEHLKIETRLIDERFVSVMSIYLSIYLSFHMYTNICISLFYIHDSFHMFIMIIN
jgi:hypothetical protein